MGNPRADVQNFRRALKDVQSIDFPGGNVVMKGYEDFSKVFANQNLHQPTLEVQWSSEKSISETWVESSAAGA